MARPTHGAARRRRRLGAGARARRAGQPLSARARHLRPLRPPARRGAVPSRLSRADGAGDGAQRPRRRLERERAWRACRPSRAARALHPSRGGHHVPDEHDLRRGPGAARAAGRDPALARQADRRPLRRAAPADRREGRRHPRHGDDREAGRQRRARQLDPRPSGRRRRAALPPGRPQVVLLGPDERRLPHARLYRRRDHLFSGAAHPARRHAQPAAADAAQGQARQQVQRLERDRVPRHPGVPARRGRPRDQRDHRHGAPHPARHGWRHPRPDADGARPGDQPRPRPQRIPAPARRPAADARGARGPRGRARGGRGAGRPRGGRLRRRGRAPAARWPGSG